MVSDGVPLGAQPAWSELKKYEEAQQFAARVGYPVLVRPSYVLSGAAMNVVRSEPELRGFLEMAADVSDDHPVVITKFIEGAEEIDVDGVADAGRLLAFAVAEHVEQGGVHSGDATLVLPARDMSKDTFGRVKEIASKVAAQLSITGPFNMQILHSPDGSLKVIETNVRASRSLPFSSKVLDVDFTRLATLAIIGEKPADAIATCDVQQQLPYVGVKVPQFSFKRLPGADPCLGVEMKSTGEVACFHHDKWGAYLRGLQSTYFSLPPSGSVVWLTLPPAAHGDKLRKAVQAVKVMQRIGYQLSAGTEDVAVLKVWPCPLLLVWLCVDLACTGFDYGGRSSAGRLGASRGLGILVCWKLTAVGSRARVGFYRRRAWRT
jgi:hypothetical protein